MWYGSSVQCKTSQQHAVSVCPRGGREGQKQCLSNRSQRRRQSVSMSMFTTEMHRQALKDLQTLHTPTPLPQENRRENLVIFNRSAAHTVALLLQRFSTSALWSFLWKWWWLTDKQRELALTSTGYFPENLWQSNEEKCDLNLTNFIMQ